MATTRLRIRRAWPIPEAITRPDARPDIVKHWKVKAGKSAYTDIAPGRMVVPLNGEDDGQAWTRRHEMAHVKWSPTVPQGDRQPWQPWIFACEDARVNMLLKAEGFDTSPGYRGPEVVTRGDGPQGYVSMALAACGTTVENDAIDFLPKEYAGIALRAIAQHARGMIAADLRDPDVTVRAAKWLTEQFKDSGSMGPGGSRCPGHSHDTEAGDERKRSEGDEPSDERPNDLTREGLIMEPGEMKAWGVPLDQEGRPKPAPLFAPFKSRSDARWGELHIMRPELTVPLSKLQAHGKWRPSDSGAVPRRMERWATDQAVFATRGRQRGGTILIDGSGSMSLSTAQIVACMNGAPAALIAKYSGRGYQGWLDILAQRGKRVREIPGRPSCNVVDGPALRWLCEQKAPRVWVSDAAITAAGASGEDSASNAMHHEIVQLCHAFRVRRTRFIENAAKLLRGDYQDHD